MVGIRSVIWNIPSIVIGVKRQLLFFDSEFLQFLNHVHSLFGSKLSFRYSMFWNR